MASLTLKVVAGSVSEKFEAGGSADTASYASCLQFTANVQEQAKWQSAKVSVWAEHTKPADDLGSVRAGEDAFYVDASVPLSAYEGLRRQLVGSDCTLSIDIDAPDLSDLLTELDIPLSFLTLISDVRSA